MKLSSRYNAPAALRAQGRATVAAAALFTLAAACPVLAAPTVKASPPATMSPGAIPTATYTAPPIIPVDAPQNKLHLTADQQNKINGIMRTLFQRSNALLANKNQTLIQRQASQAAVYRSIHTQVFAVLTPQQKTLLAQLQANQAKYIAAANDAQAKALAYKNQLQASLTTAQKNKINSIGKAAEAKIQAIVANPKLTIQQREQQGSAIRSNAQAMYKAVLTPAQLAMYANLQRYADQINALRRLALDSRV